MALCCDIRLASGDARFALPEPGLGIIPAAGGSQTLPRTVGRAAALDVLMSGRWLTAAEALKMKLVNRVVLRDGLLPEAERLAERIKSRDFRAVRYAKQAVIRGMDLPLKEALRLEEALFCRLASGGVA
jgi:enoyl-CoA hydratase/carnithine racemase